MAATKDNLQEKAVNVTDTDEPILQASVSAVRVDFPEGHQPLVVPEPVNLFKNRWTSESISCLLDKFKIHKHHFQETKLKVDAIWEMISNDINATGYLFTATQAKNKFANMKKIYMKIKDKDGHTGEAPIPFDFFDEFDELFGGNHNVTPVALASNSVPPIIATRQPARAEAREINEGYITFL